MIPLSQSRLMDHFAFEHGAFTLYLQLSDDSYLTAHLNGAISIREIKICPIVCAEDLTAFLSGIKARLCNSHGEIPVCELTDVPTESSYLAEIIRITGVDPVRLKKYPNFRGRDYVTARQMHMMVRNLVFGLSLSKSGLPYNKDHATVMHGIKTILNIRTTDRRFRERTANLFDMMDIEKIEAHRVTGQHAGRQTE